MVGCKVGTVSEASARRLFLRPPWDLPAQDPARAFIDDATRVIPHAAFAFAALAALAAIEKGDGAEAGKLAPLIESTFRASYASITRAQENW